METCSDDDEEDLKRLTLRKNQSPTSEELFPVLVAQERKARRQAALAARQAAETKKSEAETAAQFDFATTDFLAKNKFVPSKSTSSYLNTSARNNTKTDTSSNDEDDPFVKAALERFDAFCKSKSTQSLDKAGVSSPSGKRSN